MKFVAKTLQTVEAWKYEPAADVPVWVARRCHDLGNGKLTANTIVGAMPIELGDYVALIDAEQNAITVVSGEDFEREYKPLESSPPALADDLDAILREFAEARLYGQQKYGGDDPIGHDLSHPLSDWLTYIRDHLKRAEVSAPMEAREHLAKAGGLVLSACWTFDRRLQTTEGCIKSL